MGFEQLAALRDQLAQQALTQKSIKQQNKAVDTSPEKVAAKIDPVVTIKQLQNNFPLAFPKKPAPKVPLKIGIHKDILQQANLLGIQKPELLAAIKTWCWGYRYWECLVEDAVRVDLNGHAAGQVLKTDADRVRKLEEARRKKSAEIEATSTEDR